MTGLKVTVTEDFGSTGPTLSGVAGILVIPGAEGPRGITGAIGPAGPVGPTGAIGPAGPVGFTGLAGPTGPMGSISAYGEMSSAGVTGTLVSSPPWIKLLWTVEGLYSNVQLDTTSDYDFKITEAGLYLCDYHVQLTEFTTLHQYSVAIFKNGTWQTPSTSVIDLMATSRSYGGRGSVLLRCSVGDVIDTRILLTAGSGSSVGGVNITSDYGSFRVIKIAP